MRTRASIIPLLFLGGFGAVFLLVGVLLGVFAARESGAQAERAERLSPLGAARIEDGRPGDEALVEGRISERNALLFRQFVAYVREEYRGTDDDGDSDHSDDRERWVEDERRTPPLLIALSDGNVSLAGDSYQIQKAPHTWQESVSPTWTSFIGGGTKRYSGLQPGDTVLAIGRLVPGSEGPELQAEFVYGGTRAEYIADLRSAARVMPWIGGGLALIGAVLLGIGAWLRLRR